MKVNYEEVKEYFNGQGYKLIDKEIKEPNQLLNVKCSQGHKYMVRLRFFKKGYRCPICMRGGK